MHKNCEKILSHTNTQLCVIQHRFNINIIAKIEKVLGRAGSSLKDVIRTRMFVTDISRWEEYGKAHGEYFANIRPCATMVEVKGLIEPGYLIEIEAVAAID